MLATLLKIGPALLSFIMSVAGWFRIRAAKREGRMEQAIESLREAEADEAKADKAADDARATANAGGLRAEDEFTRKS